MAFGGDQKKKMRKVRILKLKTEKHTEFMMMKKNVVVVVAVVSIQH